MISKHEKHHSDRRMACRAAGMPSRLAERVICGAVDEGSEIVSYVRGKLSAGTLLFAVSGPPLIGKTVAAAFALEQLIRPIDEFDPSDQSRDVARGLWLSAFALGMLRPHDSSHADICNNYLATQTLVIDGFVAQTPAKTTWVSTLLSQRYDEGLATIVTTTMPPEKFVDAMGLGVAKRIGPAFRVFAQSSHRDTPVIAPRFAPAPPSGMTRRQVAQAVETRALLAGMSASWDAESKATRDGGKSGRAYRQIIAAVSASRGEAFIDEHSRVPGANTELRDDDVQAPASIQAGRAVHGLPF